MKDFPGISRETYINSDSPTGKSLTYDMLSDIRKNQVDIKTVFEEKQDYCSKKFDKIDKRKKFDTTCSGVAGLVGGYLAVMAQAIFRRMG